MKKNRRFIPYLFLLGPFLLIMGISAGIIADNWLPIPLILVTIGLLIIGLWLIYFIYNNRHNQLKFGRATEAGTNALIATLSVLIILGIINFFASRYSWRIDLTENQQFTLSSETIQVLQKLDKPVKVWLFETEQNPVNKEILDLYQTTSNNKLTYEFVDPQQRPDLASKFAVKEQGEVHLQFEEKRELLTRKFEPLTEPKLTNNIVNITGGKSAKVYFLQGHGELTFTAGQLGLSVAQQVLQDKTFQIDSLNLGETLKIPDDADVLVIASAKKPVLETEAQIIKNFVDRGGGLLVLIDPNTNPGLEQLFAEWGILLDNRMVIDDPKVGRMVGLDPWVAWITRYGEHPITESFGNGTSLYPFARTVQSRPIPGIQEYPLIWTNDRSWAELDIKGEVKFDAKRDRPGPLSLGVALVRSPDITRNIPADFTPILPSAGQPPDQPLSVLPSPVESSNNQITIPGQPPQVAQANTTASEGEETATNSNQIPEARLVVLGNSQFATDGWFQQQLNGDVLINSIKWLSKFDATSLPIQPRLATNRRLTMTLFQARLVAWSALVILPLIGFTTAGILWWKRR